MSPLEEEIRDVLRGEAARLAEVRPLHLPGAAAAPGPQASTRTKRAWRLRAWQAPVAAAAAVVLIAAVLVALRSFGIGRPAAPAASPSPIAGPALAADAFPRYNVQLGWFGKEYSGPTIVVGDEQARKTVGTFPLLPKGNYTRQSMNSVAVAGAADDRTFVVSAAIQSQGQVVTPLTWYLVRILPGSADPVRVTKLPIAFGASATAASPDGWAVRTIALSGDGTELAVLSSAGPWKDGQAFRLQVYSVATGQLQDSWSAGIDGTQANPDPVDDLSWVGDSTLGFAVTYTPEVREEVRTLDVSVSGGNLLADSRVAWSQYVPASQLTPEEKASILDLEPARHACDTPFLTGDGQTVVCGNSTYSARDKRLAAVWLAYPLAAPTRPRVIGSVPEPKNVSAFDGSISVSWTNPSGTEVIAAWNTTVMTGPSDNPTSTTANYTGYIGHGTVKTFPYPLGAASLGW